ncbi:hypothetical protein [Agrobacterium sp. 10MFCol1.1]|uniref:hypothetical protein n=1 Tax=Agrobacterium sp. 10MFCol1.1 TaxID=1150775 RepID=UPI000475DC9F|nr:hypothetical protein [Agrobacterium sp. 10MFCol1.1]
MEIQSGKHAGRSYEYMVLNHPDFVQWALGHGSEKMKGEFKRLIGIFDRRPIEHKCHSCANTATRASMYTGADGVMFWCDGCNEYGSGANRGKLRIVKTYGEVVHMIDNYAAGNKKFKFQTIRELARGKGLPQRVSASQAVSFFTS